MTITKEELTRPGKLIALDRSARHISHLVTCLIVVPIFPENESTRNGYLSELEKAVVAMKEECDA